MKAKALLPSPESGDFSLSRVFLLCTDDEGFIGLGEGSEGKMQGYCVVCSARAREERERFVVRERIGFSSEVDEFISEPVETTSEVDAFHPENEDSGKVRYSPPKKHQHT